MGGEYWRVSMETPVVLAAGGLVVAASSCMFRSPQRRRVMVQVWGAVKVQPGAAFLPRRAPQVAPPVSAHLTQMHHGLG